MSDAMRRWVVSEYHGFGILEWGKSHITRANGATRSALTFTPDDGGPVLEMEIYYMERQGRSWVLEQSDGGTYLGSFCWRDPTKRERERAAKKAKA
jgi:hypothetical protein